MMDLPFNYTARAYQAPLFNCLADGNRRAVAVWHRRAGKDKTALNITIREMFERVGVYYYFFPTFTEGRRILWDGIGADGFSYLDHFPSEVVAEKNKTEMKVKTKNGSLFQIIGTDGFDKVRGPNPVGCVFSEFAYQDERAWNIVRPILAENGGWAIFLYTPNGKNHGWNLYHMAQKNPEWFCELLTVDDTRRDDGTRVITQAAIDEDRASGMAEDMVLQEYYCSFTEGVVGAYYADLMADTQKTGRIRQVPYDKHTLVHTAWDLGMDDANSIIFYQTVGPWVNAIDYFEDSGKGLGYYMDVLLKKKEQLGYQYEDFFFPHDIEVRDLSQPGDDSRKDYLEKEFRIKVSVIPRIISQGHGIQAVRQLIPKLYLDETRCVKLIDALWNYRKEWDPKKKVYREYPLHDWASHGAKAAESLAFGIKGTIKKNERDHRPEQDRSESERVEIFGSSRQVRTSALGRV